MEKKTKKILVILLVFLFSFSTTIVTADDPNDDITLTVRYLKEPSNLTCSVTPVAHVNLTWIKGDVEFKTVIVRKQDTFPLNRFDGTEIYNGTASNYTDISVIAGNYYCYRAWSYWAGLFSEFYAQCSILAVEPALFDIRDILIIDDVVPSLEISVVVENQGGILADITVNWVLTRTDSGSILDMGADTFAVSPYSEVTYTITPTTSYVGSVIITFTGDGAVASGMFTTKSPPAAPPAPPYRPPRPPVVPPPVPPPPVPAPPAVPSWMLIAIFTAAICLLVVFVILIKREEEEEKKNTSKHKSARQMFMRWWNSLE